MRARLNLFIVVSAISAAAQSVSAQEGIIESNLSDSYHYVDHYEVLIDAAPGDVWPHVLDFASWMDRFDMLHESGPVRAEGQILRPYEGQEFLVEIVKLIPERIVVSVNLPSSSEGEESVGISMITLAEVDGRTLVSNFMSRQYDRSQDAPDQDAPNRSKARRASEEFKDFNRTLWDGFLANLKRLAEQ